VFKRFDYEIGTSLLGWALHYFPFYLMQRQLFLHHYFPALYFAILALCQTYDYISARIPGIGLRERPLIGRLGAVVFLGLSVVAFGLYSPLAYGNPWTQSDCKRVKLFDTWDWDCNSFLSDYSQYSTQPIIQAKVQPTSAPVIPSEAPVAQRPVREQKPLVDEQAPPMSEAPPVVSAALPAGQSIVSREEKIEYRDQDGNLLDPEQVKSLQGKVSFKTRYETRTRLVDSQGNEIHPPVDDAGVAPPHPDVDNVDRETPGVPELAQNEAPAIQSDVQVDEMKEESINQEQSKGRSAKPASESNEATA